MSPSERIILLGVADRELVQRVSAEMRRCDLPCRLLVAASLGQMQARLTRGSPAAILLDESALDGGPLEMVVRQLSESAPVVVLAGTERRTEMARLVAAGDVEFVARVGDFVPLAAGLLERRLRWAELAGRLLDTPATELSGGFVEVLRHEFNNPLTGILGNAELLLAHRDRLPATAVQRLETIVDLAVRLRETIRRLSNAWEGRPRQSRAS